MSLADAQYQYDHQEPREARVSKDCAVGDCVDCNGTCVVDVQWDGNDYTHTRVTRETCACSCHRQEGP